MHARTQKSVFWLALLASTAMSAFATAQAASIEAQSRIDKVTLYPDAAIITRRLSVDIPVGSHEVLIADLPATLDPASLRVEGSAESKISIGAVDFRLAPNLNTQKPELEKRLKSLKAERDKVHDKIEAVEGKKAMINRLAQPGESKDAKPLDIESWTKAWELIGKGLQAANDELRVLRIEETRLDEEIAAIEAASAQPKGNAPKRLAAISVEAGSASKVNLTLSYRVRGASWRPVYDARLDTRNAKPALELVRRAMIRQVSGEDWADATLTLSTLRVARGTAAPEIGAEKLAFYERPQPRPMAVSKAAPSAADAANAMREAAESASSRKYAPMPASAPPPVLAEEVQSSIDASAYQTEFTVPGKIALPSGNEEKSVRLGSETLEPTLKLKAAPVLDPTAYLEAAFTLKGETPLLAGEVLLNRDGAFIGKGQIGQIAPGDKANLGFGADDRVKITRVPVSREAKEPGLFGSTRSDEVRFRTDVKNLHAFAIEISILDRQPFSEDQQISIERLPDMTKPDQDGVDDKRGVFGWSATLKPQEARAFTNAYRIRWPQGREIRPQPMPR